MTHDLKPYPEYKDSGVEWLGRIPVHWELKPGLVAFTPKQVKNTGLTEKTVLSLSYGRIVVKPEEKLHGLVPESFETYQIVDPGEIIIRGTDLQNDKNSLRIGFARHRGIITSAYLCLKPTKIVSSEYGYHILNVYDLTKAIYRYGSGLRQNLDFSDIKRLPVFIPPRDEQDAIVRYLNTIDQRIRRFIRNRQRLIEVLNEQKQAIINRAVTRGLDPNVKLKPSGVEWLGDIPERWEARRLRTLAAVRASGVDKNTNEDEVPVMLCNYVDVYKNDRITAAIDFMKATATPEEIRAFELKAGDVIITKDSESWDDIAIPTFVPEDLPGVVCAYHLALVRPFSEEIEGEFLFRAFLSDPVADQFRVAATGVTRFGLAQGVIKGAFFPLPPLEEQRAIIAYINEKYAEISQAISRAEREIELMREYRTRLIADVVTGKVDVRGITAEQKKPARVIQFPKRKEQNGPWANVHFRRAVFAAEIVARLHKEPTFGHVKFQKLIFLCEKKCGVDLGSTYYRQAAGPYDNRALRSIDSQMKKQKWYASQMIEGRYRYVPLSRAGGHKTYFDRYFADIEKEFSKVVETFRKLDTERCEIVATLYSAWEDLLKKNQRVSDERIVHEVLNNWHESKKRIPRERWENALNWMRQNGFVPGTIRQSGETS